MEDATQGGGEEGKKGLSAEDNEIQLALKLQNRENREEGGESDGSDDDGKAKNNDIESLYEDDGDDSMLSKDGTGF